MMFGMKRFALANYFNYIIISIMLATVCATLVKNLNPDSAGSGSAEIKTILGGFVIDKYLSARTLLVKSVSLPLSIASGLCVGKEGPMIHIACCIGTYFLQFFKENDDNEAKKREVLSAACAAGVAAAFGSPLGTFM
jgi:chloride channel 3/4/5